MHYVSHCAVNNNANMKLDAHCWVPEETLVTSIQTTGPATESIRQRKLAVMMLWHYQLRTVGWTARVALTIRNVRCTQAGCGYDTASG